MPLRAAYRYITFMCLSASPAQTLLSPRPLSPSSKRTPTRHISRMAGPPRTRGRYVDQEVKAQAPVARKDKKRTEKEAIRRWTSWAAADKAALITHLDALEGARLRVVRSVHEAREAVDAKNGAEEMGVELRPHQDMAVHRCLQSKRHQQNVLVELTWLHQFYRAHDCSQPLVNNAHADVTSANQSLLRLGQLARIEQAARAVPEPVYQKELCLPGSTMDPHLLLGIHHGPYPDQIRIGDVPGHAAQDQWQGPYQVYYRSGHCLVTVWRTCEREGEMVDAVVRKDIDFQRSWSCAYTWSNVTDLANRQPMEIVCHQAMMGVPGSNVLPLRHHGIDSVHRVATIYTDLAPYGTLTTIMHAFRLNHALIPEAFIWYVLLVLTEAALAMQYGVVPDGTVEDPMIDGWKGIVHCDIKPDNIFLSYPEGRFDIYPAPKLGDFGSAIRTTDDDPLNPDWYANGCGTPGYRAPEQRRFWDARTHHPVDRYKLGAHTNVYSIGLLIRHMMMIFEERPFEIFDDDIHNIWPAEDFTRNYTSTLRGLVANCLQMRPHLRLTLDDLYAAIRVELEDEPEAAAAPAFVAIRSLYSNRASQDLQDRNTVYRQGDTATDLRPEPFGDARFRNVRTQDRVINLPPIAMRDALHPQNILPIGRLSSWWHRPGLPPPGDLTAQLRPAPPPQAPEGPPYPDDLPSAQIP